MMAARSDELVRRETGAVFDSVAKLAAAIRELEQRHIVVSPGGAMGGSLPVLHSAGVSFVFVDPERDTYPIPGRAELGVGKNALDRISAAAGVRWDPHLCGCADDGKDPHVVEYQAVGTVRQLDGTERMISAVKRIDLRAWRDKYVDTWGSDAQEIARIAKSKNRDPWPQILQQRAHILSLAESKSKNRAIRSLGVRTAYTVQDLQKGFAVVRLQFTGRHEDPEVERQVALMVAEKALGSSAALYGPRPALQSARGPVPRLVAAAEEDDSYPPFPAAAAAPAAPPPARPAGEVPGRPWGPPPPADEPAADDDPWDDSPQSQASSRMPSPPSFDPQVPAGKGRGTCAASSLSADDLDRLGTYLAGQRDAGKWKPQYAEKDQARLDAVVEWAAFKRWEEGGGR